MSDLKERLRASTSTHHSVSTEGEDYATIERIHLPPAIQVEAAARIEALEEQGKDASVTIASLRSTIDQLRIRGAS